MSNDVLDRPSVVVKRRAPGRKRNLNQVPFVEIHNGRVQGIVSSGSDMDRVYCSFFAGTTGNFYCSTNNNRRCGGLGGPCKHIGQMLDQAIASFGADEVAAALKIDPGMAKNSRSVFGALRGAETKEPAGVVFSRFLADLHYVELAQNNLPLPEMAWFYTV